MAILLNDPVQYKAYARQGCAARDIDWPTYDSQINLESGWRQYDASGNILSSPSGSMGLGQLNSRFYPASAWTDPYINLDNSMIILKIYLNRYGSYRKALAAYNWGPGNVGGYVDDSGVVHTAWDGTKTWLCAAGHGLSAQVIHYLDTILGEGWPEPNIAPPISMPVDPTPLKYGVGPGVKAKMDYLGDSPATDETYIASSWSMTFGKSGRMYVYLQATNETHTFEPGDISEVTSPIIPSKPGGASSGCWDSVNLITAGFSTPSEWSTTDPRTINGIVWHDMEGWLAGAIATWNTGVAGAHLCILRDGSVVLTVALSNIAWHAGTNNVPGSGTYGRTPFWRSHNINPTSIGIELEGFVVSGYTPQQIDACVRVGVYLTRMYGIEPSRQYDNLEGHHLHSEISAMRSDPGPLFPIDEIISRIIKETAE